MRCHLVRLRRCFRSSMSSSATWTINFFGLTSSCAMIKILLVLSPLWGAQKCKVFPCHMKTYSQAYAPSYMQAALFRVIHEHEAAYSTLHRSQITKRRSTVDSKMRGCLADLWSEAIGCSPTLVLLLSGSAEKCRERGWHQHSIMRRAF